MKKYKVLISGHNNFDEPFTEIIEIKAINENHAFKIAKNQNGVYSAEVLGDL